MQWTRKPKAYVWSALRLRGRVFGSKIQAKDHGLGTVQRSCVPDLTPLSPHASPPRKHCWGGQAIPLALPSPPVIMTGSRTEPLGIVELVDGRDELVEVILVP